MTPHATSALLIALSLAISTASVAQTPTPDPTAPSAASSPHQRDTTSTKATEAPPATSTSPAAASTPHQGQVVDADKGDAKTRAKHEQMLKDCVAKEQAKNSTQSTEQAKKTCGNQMKAHTTDTKK